MKGKKSKIKVRRSWNINPRTRIHDNNIKKNIKKSRQEARIDLKEEY